MAWRQAGCQAIHLAELGLLAATDREVWEEAVKRNAILVTKDRDFSLRRATRNDGPTIVWIRVGNADNKSLIANILLRSPAIIDAVERGETVIEFVGR